MIRSVISPKLTLYQNFWSSEVSWWLCNQTMEKFFEIPSGATQVCVGLTHTPDAHSVPFERREYAHLAGLKKGTYCYFADKRHPTTPKFNRFLRQFGDSGHIRCWHWQK